MEKKNSLRMSQKKKKDLIFYCCLLAYPIASFCVFYIVINANSILLAFKESKGGNTFDYLEFNNIFYNFKDVLTSFFGDAAHRDSQVASILTNSLKAFCAQVLIALPLGILFSYYIFKKSFLSGTFKVILFLPSIISSVVMCYIFSNMVGDCYKTLAEKLFNTEVSRGLLDNPDTRFNTLIFYQLWVGFGTTILLFSGAMSGINESVLEAGKVDGASNVREFFNIVFPLTFPTLIVFITMQLANLFLNQINIYPFFGQNNKKYDIYTMGFYLYDEAINARGGGGRFPYISALGCLLTLFIAPITILVNFLMKKFGPSAD